MSRFSPKHRQKCAILFGRFYLLAEGSRMAHKWRNLESSSSGAEVPLLGMSEAVGLPTSNLVLRRLSESPLPASLATASASCAASALAAPGSRSTAVAVSPLHLRAVVALSNVPDPHRARAYHVCALLFHPHRCRATVGMVGWPPPIRHESAPLAVVYRTLAGSDQIQQSARGI